MTRNITTLIAIAATGLFSICMLAYAQVTGTDEQAIRRQLQAYADARTRQEARAEAMFYADDGDFLPMGSDRTMIRGRTEIERRLATNEGPNFRFTLSIEHVRLLTADVGLVDASYASQLGKGHVVYVMVKRAGSWLIAAARPA